MFFHGGVQSGLCSQSGSLCHGQRTLNDHRFSDSVLRTRFPQSTINQDVIDVHAICFKTFALQLKSTVHWRVSVDFYPLCLF